MRHGKKINHLSRKYGHRNAMLSNMATSLIIHKRIFTTTAKAKELRGFVEPLITKAKNDNTHSRRVVFSYLQDKDSVKELFSTVVEKVGDRPGGYTRILKTHNRKGDNAEMCMMELVDFNELMLEQTQADTSKSSSSKRTRRGRKSGAAKAAAAVTDTVEKVKDKVEDVAEEVADKVEDVVEDAKEVVEDVVEEVKDVVEDVKDAVTGDDDDDDDSKAEKSDKK